MRLNKFVASATGMSRRKADDVIAEGRVKVRNNVAGLGLKVEAKDTVTLDDKPLHLKENVTIMLNKPVGYICSRNGQGSQTIYDLLPPELHNLNAVGRLDKDSSGLLLLTNDGELAYKLTHPSFEKDKVYEIELDKALPAEGKAAIEHGVKLEDGSSALQLNGKDKKWIVTMSEGRNRQIRRTFEKLDLVVTKLHRIQFGSYSLADLAKGKYQLQTNDKN